MLVASIIYILGYLLALFFAVVNPLLGTTSFVTATQVGNGASYIFGNLQILNEWLPVTEMLYLASVALVFKAGIFSYKVFLWFMSISRVIRRTFVQWNI